MNLAGGTPLTEIRGVTQDSPAPQSVRFPCGNHVTIPPRGVRGSGWTGVLRAIATWLVDNERLTLEIARLQHPRVPLYVTSNTPQQYRPRRSDNRYFEEINNSGVYFYKSWEAQDAVDGAVELVRYCEENPCEILVNY
ncbi:MAG: hypothetical protein F4W91_00395 [Gemmatimonadetes bacterium]|nr:hypothetical protein [Gemmatimonadota bacterium]